MFASPVDFRVEHAGLLAEQMSASPVDSEVEQAGLAELADELIGKANTALGVYQDPQAILEVMHDRGVQGTIEHVAEALERVAGEDGKLVGEIAQHGYDWYKIAQGLCEAKPGLDPTDLVKLIITTPQVVTSTLRSIFPSLEADPVTAQAEQTVIAGAARGARIAGGSVMLAGALMFGPAAPVVWGCAAGAAYLGAGVGAAWNVGMSSTEVGAEQSTSRAAADQGAGMTAMAAEEKTAKVVEELAAALPAAPSPLVSSRAGS
eukprot:TRINITY_DN11716_c0_g2_i1.p1 TRINITY_DN11716_c0_g2~~TRINITY_DN11716_c0_g2_i1.p1  ORF type:complete len:262 (-),score=47.70 TRINITY_DN11716_c0_g2_i1:67-852(-)